MRNATTSDLSIAADRKDAGEAWKSILADTGLNYSQAWYFWARRTLETNLPTALIEAEADLMKLGKQVAIARHGGNGTDLEAHAATPDGYDWITSWGGIAVRCNLPESRIRRAYEQATNIHTDGQRKGKGGRFLKDDAGFYMDQARKVGIRYRKGEAPQYPNPETMAERFGKLSPAQLRALLRKEGVNTKNMKKADMVATLLGMVAEAEEQRKAAQNA